MTRTSPPQVAFSSGEIDPLLHRRFDFQRFQTGLATCNGFYPLKQGAFTRAPGTIFRGFTRDNALAVRVPFEFARDDSLSVEFTDGKARIWRYGALVETAGVPYEIDTPFPEASLANLCWVQSADVIYITDGQRELQKLSRYALDNWTIGPTGFTTGPFRTQNIDETLTLLASATTGTITLTASAAFFVAEHVGSLVLLKPTDWSAIPYWTTNDAVSVGDKRRYNAIGSVDYVYELTAGSNTGTVAPIHSEGTQKVDPNGATWRFVSDDSGIVRITAVTDSTHATATVLKTVPDPCATDASYRWAEGAWSDRYGYPQTIELFDQRMVAAATPAEPRTAWFSGVGDFTDWEPGTDADSSFAYVIAGDSSINRIIQLKRGGKGLHIFSLGEEYSSRSDTASQAIGPTTAYFSTDSSKGAATARPIAPDGDPIFICKDKARIYQMAYDLQSDRNRPTELSLPSQHLGAEGFEQIVFQASPMGLAFLRRGDGTLAVMLQDRQQDVLGWARMSLAGGFVEAMDVTASADGAYDVLTMVVRRTLGGETVRCVEELALTYGLLTGTQPIAEAVHLFCAEIFTPETPADTFTVAHLAGETVWAWTDLGNYGPLTVADDGTLTLPDAVSRATIGLFDDTHLVETLDVQAAASDGNTMGRRKRLHTGAGIAVHRTADGTVSGIERSLGSPDRVGPAMPIIPRAVASVPTQAFTGVASVAAQTGQAHEVAYRFAPKGGAPMTITGVVPIVEEAGR